jgi:isopentenyl phosphate kinase
VKLGGSVITDKTRPFTERIDVIRRLAGEIHSAKQDMNLNLIVGHGGGSYPHTPAAKFRVNEGRSEGSSPHGVALVQDAAARLNRLVVAALIDAGEDAISVQPSASVLANTSKIISWNTEVLEAMLDAGLLPVVYGDVVMNTIQGWSIASTEDLFLYLATHLPVERIVIGSDVDGVLDRAGRGAKFDVITPRDFKRISASLEGAGTVDVTGGMRSKVESLLQLADTRSVEGVILNAAKPGLLEAALKGAIGIGTAIRASNS